MTSAGGIAFQLQAIVQNVSELVGHDVSVVAFVPRWFVDQPDDYTVDYEGTAYTRMFSNYYSPQGWYSAIPSAHPLTPYPVNFVRNVSLPPGPQPAPSISAVVRVFDQFGLAMAATFSITIPQFEIQLMKETHAAKRSPSALAAGRLE